MFLKACLNGNRTRGEHPGVPLTSGELAVAARDVVAAGADALHLHPRESNGKETFDPGFVGEALRAVRAACPGVLVGVSTGAWIEPDVTRRVALVQSWEVLPDFASVNLSETGAEEVMEVLLAREVRVEAGLWAPEDVMRLAASGHAPNCLRLLLEPRDEDPDDAASTVRETEAELDRYALTAPRLLHGRGTAAWPVFDLAVARGYGSRIGLEDTLRLPSGELAPDNAALVRAARARA